MLIQLVAAMPNTNTQKPNLTPQEHHALECALIQELLETLQKEPRRTTVVLSSLFLLIRGFSRQLPPEGVADVAFLAGSLAGELLESSAKASPSFADHIPASRTTH